MQGQRVREVHKSKHLAQFCEWATMFCELVVREARDAFKVNNPSVKVPFKTWREFKTLASLNPAISSYFTKIPVTLGITYDWKLVIEFKGKRSDTFHHPEIDINVRPAVDLPGDLSVYKVPLEKVIEAVCKDYQRRVNAAYCAME